MKKLAGILFFIFIFIFSFLILPAQTKHTVKKTIRVETLLPKPISNKAFKQLFSGVFSANISMNFGVKNFNTGVYYNMMQSQIFPKYQQEPHSIQTVHTAGIRFGYDFYPSKARMASGTGNYRMVSPFMAGGFNQIDYSRLICITKQATGKHAQAYNFYGGANLNLMFSEYDGIGFTIGYNFLHHEFDPDALCLDEYYKNITDNDTHGFSQYILFGFNAYFDLVKRDNGFE